MPGTKTWPLGSRGVTIVRGANLALRFFLELGAFAAAAYWGYEAGSGFTRWLLAIVAPAVLIAVWGLFVAPKAGIRVARPLQFAIELSVWAAATAALYAAGAETLAVTFGIVAVVSGALNYIWRE